MAKLIIRFMNFVIGFWAGLFMICGGVGGLLYALDDDPWLMMIYIPLGLIAGFISATIVLGIPLLALRINQNLEEINSNIKNLQVNTRKDIPSFD